MIQPSMGSVTDGNLQVSVFRCDSTLAGEARNFSHAEMGERWQRTIFAGSFLNSSM
jgi:hypothetical protein